jgi:hypothetical protein
MTTLASLLTELQSEVPPVNSVPTTDQYKRAIKDAVAEFSRICGLEKIAELNIVSGTASYDMPADFLELIMLHGVYGSDGVILSASGIIPLPQNWKERYQVLNKVITFFPTPAYTLTRQFRYKAAWILTGAAGSETYADMSDDEAQIVMLKAKSIATEKVANASASSGAMRYSFGAVSVDKSSGVDRISKSVSTLHSQFMAACQRYNGTRLAIS